MSSLATLVNLELKVKCAWPEQNAYLQADHAMHHSQTSENRFLSLIQLAESEIYCFWLNSFTLRMARAPYSYGHSDCKRVKVVSGFLV